MFTNILNQVFLMFVLVGIGFILNKIQFLHKETGSDLTNILLYVISPALILKSMQQDRSSYSLKIIALVVIALVILYFIAILLSNASFSHLHSLDMNVVQLWEQYILILALLEYRLQVLYLVTEECFIQPLVLWFTILLSGHTE